MSITIRAKSVPGVFDLLAYARHDVFEVKCALHEVDVDSIDIELHPLGHSDPSHLHICGVLTGEVEAYVHAGGQYEWDSAAPVAVALKAGAHASRIDGAPLTYNQEDPLLPDILVSLPDLAPKLLAGISHLKEDRNDASA